MHANFAGTNTKDYHLEQPVWDMFQRIIEKIFQDLPNVFSIADDILVAGYGPDGKDHDKTLWRVVQMCRQVNLKVNKDKCYFRCISVPFLVKSYPNMVWSQTHKSWKCWWRCLLQKQRRELQAFLVIINHLSKFSPSTCQHMWVTKTVDIDQNRMDMEWNIPQNISQGKINNQRCMHEILQ